MRRNQVPCFDHWTLRKFSGPEAWSLKPEAEQFLFASNQRGFTLVEVLIAIALMTTIALGVAQLFALATNANMSAKEQTSTAILAAEKLEQLRGLAWGLDGRSDLRLPVSDTTTDLSTDPPSNAGRGLSSSPAGTLDRNTPGYVDYLDARGRWVGTGPTTPAQTVYIRRWSVEPLPADPTNTLVLQVLVTTWRSEGRARTSGRRQRRPGDTWLVSVKTRKAP